MLLNLGSPDSYSVPDVRRYLRQFLMDERVIDVPYVMRTVLVKGIIVPFRAKNSATAYKSIWDCTRLAAESHQQPVPRPASGAVGHACFFSHALRFAHY